MTCRSSNCLARGRHGLGRSGRLLGGSQGFRRETKLSLLGSTGSRAHDVGASDVGKDINWYREYALKVVYPGLYFCLHVLGEFKHLTA